MVLNDNDVSILFGWAVLKSKRKHCKLTKAGLINQIYDTKLDLLEDMMVKAIDRFHNIRYTRLYYPFDDQIGNKG